MTTIDDIFEDLYELMVDGSRELLAAAQRARDTRQRVEDLVEVARKAGGALWKEQTQARRSPRAAAMMAAETGSVVCELGPMRLVVDRGRGAELGRRAFGRPLRPPAANHFRVYFVGPDGALAGVTDLTIEEAVS